MVNRGDAARHYGAERAGALECRLFERLLDVGVDGQRDDLAALRCPYRLIGRMRREHRHRPAPAMHDLGLGEHDLVRGYAVDTGTIEHAIARAFCDLGEAIRTPRFG